MVLKDLTKELKDMHVSVKSCWEPIKLSAILADVVFVFRNYSGRSGKIKIIISPDWVVKQTLTYVYESKKVKFVKVLINLT